MTWQVGHSSVGQAILSPAFFICVGFVGVSNSLGRAWRRYNRQANKIACPTRYFATSTCSVFALASIMSITRWLGPASGSRVVGRGPLTVK